jgi:2-methylisocitrate lyase-like PEP mutase family enzyme
MTSLTAIFRNLLNTKKMIVAPGVFDGLSARLVEQAGFNAVYVSGGAVARSCGYPDLGLLSITEVLQRIEQIVEVTNIPVIADADTGFGNVLNTYRTVRAFERAGVCALHLEDQTFPKRCGHLNDKKIVSKEEMMQKIRAARDALKNPEVVIIARTDAIATEGFDAAIERACAYREAGADMLFIEAPQTLEQIQKIPQLVNAPTLINMFAGGKTPLVPSNQLNEWGYSVEIIPSDLQRAAIFAMEKTLKTILRDGDSHVLAEEMTTFNQREVIIATEKYLGLDKKYSDNK